LVKINKNVIILRAKARIQRNKNLFLSNNSLVNFINLLDNYTENSPV